MESRIILFHKPYGVLSQFSREGTWESLADYGPFPKAVYPAGRLDADSEGLLLLTDDNRIKHGYNDSTAIETSRGGRILHGQVEFVSSVTFTSAESARKSLTAN